MSVAPLVAAPRQAMCEVCVLTSFRSSYYIGVCTVVLMKTLAGYPVSLGRKDGREGGGGRQREGGRMREGGEGGRGREGREGGRGGRRR